MSDLLQEDVTMDTNHCSTLSVSERVYEMNVSRRKVSRLSMSDFVYKFGGKVTWVDQLAAF